MKESEHDENQISTDNKFEKLVKIGDEFFVEERDIRYRA